MAPFEFDTSRRLGAPLRIATDAGVAPALGGLVAARRVQDASFTPEIPPAPTDPALLDAWLARYANFDSDFFGHPSLGWVVLAGVAVAAVYVLSILAHELGHALAAQAYGISLDAIELTMLGGFVSLEDDDGLTAGSWAGIVAAGPAVTAALTGLSGGALLLLGWPLVGIPDAGTSAEVVAQQVLSAAFVLNAIVLAANLLPIGELDGRQLLRAGKLRRSRSGR